MPQFKPQGFGPPKRERPSQRKIALVLTAIAGSVDALGYLMLAHVYVANMSGNSISLGLGAAKLNGSEAFRHGWPIAMFVIGLVFGAVVAEVQRRRGVRRGVGWTLALQSLALCILLLCAGLLLGWHGRSASHRWASQIILAGIAAIAMGVQNVTLRAAGALTVYTTHVTGALTQLTDDLVQYGLWVYDHLPRSASGLRARLWRLIRGSPRHPSFREMVFLGGLWCGYVIGAAAGAWALLRWGAVAVSFPTVALIGVALFELIRANPTKS